MRRNLKQQLEKLLSKHWGLYLGIIVVSLIIIGYTLNAIYSSDDTISDLNEREKTVPLTEGFFSAPYLTAESAIVWDVRAGKAIYKKNASTAQPLASITKIMTALTALESVPKNTTVTINASALSQDGDSGLSEGERWTLADLVDFSLIESSNDGVAAVAGSVGALYEGLPEDTGVGRVSFIDLMNQKADQLGLTHMSFENESGLDIWNETEASSYGSAEDVAKLFSYVLTTHPEIFEPTTQDSVSFRSLSGNTYTAENTNRALDDIPALIGSKTGYTDISGGNLGVIIDPGINYPFVIVVLGSSFEDRFADVVALSEQTLEYLAPKN